MKIIKLLFAFVIMAALFSACNYDNKSKADSWNDQQKTVWTNKCTGFMKTNGVEEKAAVDFCDCMLDKTSEKYTPEEAANITEEEERKLWEECDYTW